MSNEIELTVKGTPEAIGRLLNPLRAEYVPPSISVPAIALEDIDGPDLPTLSAKPRETTRTVTMRIDPALAEWATEGSDKPDLPVMNAKPDVSGKVDPGKAGAAMTDLIARPADLPPRPSQLGVGGPMVHFTTPARNDGLQLAATPDRRLVLISVVYQDDDAPCLRPFDIVWK